MEDISKLTNLSGFGSDIFIKMLMQILKIDDLNGMYNDIRDQTTTEFVQSVIDKLDIRYECSDEDLARIPVDGSFVSVSNHPYGGIEGIILLHMIKKRRPDYKLLANFLLQKFEPLKESIIGVNPFDHLKSVSNYTGMKDAITHVKKGYSMGIFPAGEVSSLSLSQQSITDRKWNKTALKMIKSAEVPILPIYFDGVNSLLFQLLGMIHPLFRTAQLPNELLNKKNQTIKIRIGQLISVREQRDYPNIYQYGRYLRAMTYSLGSSLEVKRFFSTPKHKVNKKEPEKIIDPIAIEKLDEEIKNIRSSYLLFDSSNYSVYLACSRAIPNIMDEIGRLREITFREIGEGTNKSQDLDEYDLYYHQLFIWDNDAHKIVGAYRIGKGREIMAQYGRKGFYVNTLFKLKKEFTPILTEGLEMGRSFIVKEYQRKPASLFLLWKGIGYTLLKNTDYRYMLGPVSLSNNFSDLSKTIMVSHIKEHHFNQKLAKCVRARNPYQMISSKKSYLEFILDVSGDDINKLDAFVRNMENGIAIPVLLKKYLGLNAKIIGFNVDPDFSNCLDGLVVADIFDFPQDMVKSLLKEIDIEKITSRFQLFNPNSVTRCDIGG